MPTARRRPTATAGVFAAVVTRADAAGVFVEAGRLAPGREFGPCQAVRASPDYARLDLVLVSFLEGRPDELVVLGPLR